jgi:hypothetical protein
MALPIVLAALGGLFELGGLALVVLEIGHDRKLAERYLDEIETEPSPGLTKPYVRPEMRIVNEMQMARGSTEEQLKRARQQLEQDLTRTNDVATRAIYRERQRFQNLVRDLLQGGLGQRKIGAALLAVGILLSVSSNVASSLQ